MARQSARREKAVARGHCSVALPAVPLQCLRAAVLRRAVAVAGGILGAA
ncbi:hypothetical protein [Eubacterium callanderi]|nr:hypothetical protein [Eubacterium callanderi]